MLIRRYRDGDGAFVRDLFVRVNRELAPDVLREEFEAYIAQALAEEIDRIGAYYAEQNGSFWIIEEAGSRAAMYGLECADGKTAEIRRMYVDPAMRRRGLGRAMLAHAGEVCRDAGIEVLRLSTSELQVSALAFYRACGFRFTHEETAAARTNKTIGLGLRRFHFKWTLRGNDAMKVRVPTASTRRSWQSAF